MIKDKIDEVIGGLETFQHLFSDIKIRSIEQRAADAVVHETLKKALELKQEYSAWGAQPSSTPAHNLHQAHVKELVLHEMRLYEIRWKDGSAILFDGHFNRSGVDIAQDTFPVTLEGLELTRSFERSLEQLLYSQPKGSILNAKAIRNHALGIWHKTMQQLEDDELRCQNVKEFTDFMENVDVQLQAVQGIRVGEVAVFELQD